MNGTPGPIPPSVTQPTYMAAPQERPRSTGLKIYSVIITIFLLMSLALNAVLFIVAIAAIAGVDDRDMRTPQETVIGGDERTENKIVVIDIKGIIGSEGGLEDGMVGKVRKHLEAALKDGKVKAILLSVDSPGGEVTASDTIYKALKEAREKKPVVVYISSVGASGAYYIAMGSSHVVCAETGITGSIGVIGQTLNIADMLGKIGVQAHTFKSGRNKDLMNPLQKAPPDVLEEQKRIVQNLIDEMYERFLSIVAEERNLDKERLRTGVADGRVVSGIQAKEANLVDSLGTFEDAVERAKDLSKTNVAKLIKYETPISFRTLLELFAARGAATSVQVEVLPSQFRIEAGKLYYLSHHFAH